MNRQTTPKRARGTSRRSSKRGLAPGSVVFIGAAREQAAGISLIEYGTDALRETRFTSLEQSRQHEATLPMRWLNVYGVHDTRVLAEIGQRFGLQKTLVAVQGCRQITKASMVHNAWLPRMEIDAQTYAVRADGVLLTCEPATVLPMAQRYFLF